ncbi:MAG: LysR family transcriptional regulator [Pseudomonadota bacterium]
MRINFDFLDLEAFLAVKETASFQAAAQRLNLSQSSVTRRVQKLEEALGTALFERTTRDVRPTLAAKRLQLRAEAMLQSAQETTRALHDESAALAYQKSQIITLATIPTVVGSLVIPAVQALREAGHPARFRILDLAANQVAEAVSQAEADFGIGSIPMLEPVTQFEPLLTDPIMLVVPPDHRLAQFDEVTWRDLTREALIVPARGTGNRLSIDEALARHDNTLSWTYEVGRSSTALEFVSNGIGIALLPKMAVTGPLADRLVLQAVSDPEISRSIGLISRIGQTDMPVVAAFKKSLMAQGAR